MESGQHFDSNVFVKSKKIREPKQFGGERNKLNLFGELFLRFARASKGLQNIRSIETMSE